MNDWSSSETELYERLGSSPDGLSDDDAQKRRKSAPKSVGVRHMTPLQLLLRQFANPIILILSAVAGVSALLGEVTQSLIVLAIIGLSSVLGFVQERGAVRAVQTLMSSVSVHADVIRDGREREIAVDDVVPGDVVSLRTGDVIPGDGRIIVANQLRLDESSLTGEVFPRHKSPGTVGDDTALRDRSNMVYFGTYVASGEGRVLVMHTGVETEFGRIGREVSSQHLPTAFERGITSFGFMLMRATAVLVSAILLVNVVLHRPVTDSILFSLALAVGLTPQMLPAIVTLSLSRGAVEMAKSKVIVKRLDAIEDIGSLDVLCTDKTGTITVGAVKVRGSLDYLGRDDPRAFQWASLTARHQRGFKNPLDDAILAHPLIDAPLENSPVAAQEISADEWSFEGEVPFDFVRKRMSVLVRSSRGRFLVTKGALEPLLVRCAFVEHDATRLRIDQVRSSLQHTFEQLSHDGFRVLGVAYRELTESKTLTGDDERDLVFSGFLAFVDPPKPGAQHAISTLGDMGVSVRIITGDNRLAAGYVASQVGLDPLASATGKQVAALSDDELATFVEGIHTFAEVDPIQKERIVRAFSHGGHTVGFLGDGINDSPALHAADVGISVDSAVDVAKQTADLVLLTKDLGVLAQGIKQGRRIFVNTLKYVHVTTSANFGNMVSLAAATMFLPFLPMLPLQVLLLNFLSDIPGLSIATDTVDEELLRTPRTWDTRHVRSFMIVFGLTSTVFDLLTFASLRLGFDASAELLRSGWLVESTLTELAALLVLRTNRRAWQSRPGSGVLASSLVVAAVTFALPYSPLAGTLGLVGLPWAMAVVLMAIIAGYVIVSEAFKVRFASLADEVGTVRESSMSRPSCR